MDELGQGGDDRALGAPSGVWAGRRQLASVRGRVLRAGLAARASSQVQGEAARPKAATGLVLAWPRLVGGSGGPRRARQPESGLGGSRVGREEGPVPDGAQTWGSRGTKAKAEDRSPFAGELLRRALIAGLVPVEVDGIWWTGCEGPGGAWPGVAHPG